jgi:hypothetical protein
MSRRTYTFPAAAAALAAGLLVSACGPKQPGDAPVQASEASKPALSVFPPPPDTARIQYLATFATAEDVEQGKKKGGSFLSAIVGNDDKDDPRQRIYKPYGVSIANGRIYSCDTMLQAVIVMDLVGRELAVLQPTEGDGMLAKPINCFADPQDNALYVADVGRSAVLVYDSLLEFSGFLGDEGDIVRPVDVQVRGDTVWVADQLGHQVAMFDRGTRRKIGAIPEYSPDSPEGIRQPTNLWVTENEVYVSDFGDFQVKVYTHGGEFIRPVGQYGRGYGMFMRPKGIAVDREGLLYVVDAGFHNVQMFNPEGQVLMFFGGADTAAGGMYLPAKVFIDYDNLDLFRDKIDPRFEAKYLVLVTNQYGPNKITAYARVEPKTAGAVAGAAPETTGEGG